MNNIVELPVVQHREPPVRLPPQPVTTMWWQAAMITGGMMAFANLSLGAFYTRHMWNMMTGLDD